MLLKKFSIKKGADKVGFNYSKLRGRIVEIFGSQTEFSKAIKISERSLSLKMKGKVSWKQSEIVKAISLLGLKKDDIAEYFFTIKSQDV